MAAGFEERFKDEIDQRHMCPICLLVLRNAVQTACGHRFCEVCLDRARSVGTSKTTEVSCPIDKVVSKSNQVFPDIATQREIMSLPVECRNFEKGCSWQGELRDIEPHRVICPQESIECPNKCEEMTERRRLEEHLSECPAREVECVHCENRVVHNTLELHLKDCPKLPVECDQCHETDLARDDLSHHKDPDVGTCPMTVISCPFSFVGCTFTAERHAVKEHSSRTDALAEHMMMAATVIHNHSKTIKDLTNKVNRMASKTDDMFPTVIHSQKRLNQLGRELRERNMTGQLQWKVKLRGYNYNDRGTPSRRSVTSYCSPTFYTGCPGYQVQLTLYMDGYRENGISYVSLSLALLPGDYDDNIVFPFNATCTVVLFDQTDAQRNNVEQQIVVRQMPRHRSGSNHTSSTYKREILKYMKCSDLVGRRSQYVRQGCLHFEIEIRQSFFPPPDPTCTTSTYIKNATTPRRNGPSIQGASPQQIMGVGLSPMM